MAVSGVVLAACCSNPFLSGGGGIRKRRRSGNASSPCPLSNRGFRFLSMIYQVKSRYSTLESATQKRVPIFVMMPADAFEIDCFGNPKIRRLLSECCNSCFFSLSQVNPTAYFSNNDEERKTMWPSFGSSVNGKGCISLPLWILKIGHHNRDIYFRDQNGFVDDNCLTLGVDRVPLFGGRTALKCYEDFMSSFTSNFESLMGSVIEEVSIGLGPSGELRYPSHPVDGRWRFPGIGEFQCYDKYMMEDLKRAACQKGKPEWGDSGPKNAGDYNSLPSGLPFFDGKECFLSSYSQFFLEWYSGRLIQHADAILSMAVKIMKKCQQSSPDSVLFVAKVGTIYWWYQTLSHAAELTAGYYNTALRDGYDPLVWTLSQHGVALHISCFEMLDREMPSVYLCSPEGLVQQLRKASKARTVHVTGRNANERFDKAGLYQIIANCCRNQMGVVRSFTYFRMNAQIFGVQNWNNFVIFVREMNGCL